MELLGERPVWSMTGGEMLSDLDAVNAEIARLKTRGLHLVAGLESTGYAQEIGAHDTARLLTFRYRLDGAEAHRDVHLARAFPKYPTVTAALPNTTPPPATAPTPAPPADGPAPTQSAADPAGSGADDVPADGASGGAALVDSALADGAVADGGAGDDAGGAGRRPLHPAQAQAIVWALERVAARVPVEHLAVAEEQLVGLAAHLSPGQLRKAGKEIADLLDSDGPEPDEHKAYARESLTLASAENGVKFRGFLANENAELLRALTHAGARPHKTIDGDLDPRHREKRQADALTTALTIAATVTETGHTPPTNPAPSNPTTAPAAPFLTPAPATSAPTRAPRTAPTRNSATPATGDPATSASRDSATSATGDPATSATGDPATSATGDPATSATGDPATSATGSPAATATRDPAAGSTGTAGGAGGWVPGFGAKANITVTIDFNDLKAATADATGQLVYGDALSAAAIRRLACDATIIPLVLGSNSEPLDVGRSERLVNRAMRRALNARDKGCVVCAAPPIHCDAHHVRSWIDGGPTAITNLVLLCRRHHIDLHAGHWTITITNGTVQVTRPTWADPPPTPHRPPPRPSPAHRSVESDPLAPHHRPAPQHSPAHGSVEADPPDVPPPNGIPIRAGAVGLVQPDPWDDSATTSARASRPASPEADSWSRVDGTDGVSAAEKARPGPWDDCATTSVRASRPAPAEGDTRSRVDGTDGVSAAEKTRPDPWGESGTPEPATRRSRWAKEGDLEEAARFAVWGDTARMNQASSAAPPPSR